MRFRNVLAICFSVLPMAAAPLTQADDFDARFAARTGLTFTTLSITPFAIEGLTGDNGFLYTTGRAPAGTRCPVWKIDSNAARPVTPVQIGSIPNDSASLCNPSGVTFDKSGNLYIADAAQGGVIWRVSPSSDPDPTAPYAKGVPGTNGLAFDRYGDLWTGDGTTGLGRVWVIAPGGGTCEPSFSKCVEIFRVPPLVNNFGVGRQVATVQPGSTTPNPQPLVVNGFAFDPRGNLLIADTARGAIWRIIFDRNGNLASPRGCDITYVANTLCFSNVLVQHPLLEGVDGIALDRAGNIWNAANERNAIVLITGYGVFEVFRNPVNMVTALRNAAETAEGNRHILELPTSPFLLGNMLCVAQSDGDRRDNSPRAAGEVNGGAATPGARGKISCADQRLTIGGLPLPVQ